MAAWLLSRESPTEYFKELVEGALARQRIAAGQLTAFYVVNLLTGCVRHRAPMADDAEPLTMQLIRALEDRGIGQRARLKAIGDLSLFTSGFFSDSLHRKLVDLDYYVTVGGHAYGSLSRVDTDTLSPVFAELAEKFASFVDVLGEVSERSGCATNADLLRLYERWLKTGSPWSRQLLKERGVVPGPAVSHRVQ